MASLYFVSQVVPPLLAVVAIWLLIVTLNYSVWLFVVYAASALVPLVLFVMNNELSFISGIPSTHLEGGTIVEIAIVLAILKTISPLLSAIILLIIALNFKAERRRLQTAGNIRS